MILNNVSEDHSFISKVSFFQFFSETVIEVIKNFPYAGKLNLFIRGLCRIKIDPEPFNNLSLFRGKFTKLFVYLFKIADVYEQFRNIGKGFVGAVCVVGALRLGLGLGLGLVIRCCVAAGSPDSRTGPRSSGWAGSLTLPRFTSSISRHGPLGPMMRECPG